MKKVLTEKKSVLTIGFPQQVNHSQRARDTPLRVWFWQKNVELLLLPIVIVWQDYVKGVPMLGQCFFLWRLVLELEIPPPAHRKRTSGFFQVT